MKKIRLYISLLLMLPFVAGCDDFLNVNPKGEVFDNDMFTSADGYEDALYGIYAELGTKQYLYSDYMFWLPEVLSANINTTNNRGLENMSKADWEATDAPAIRKGIWTTTYTTINHINNILAHIETGGEDEFPYTKLYKGEALGLRAMLHFEMLKFFGAPVWASEADKARAIPYVTKYSFDITPFSSFDETCKKIIADLLEAERCLAEDETMLPVKRNNASAGGFTSCRVIHMNLYAVQALLARVYWYKKDLENAAKYAEKVILSGKFSFRPFESFNLPDHGTLDLNETIFGIYSTSSNIKNNSAYYRNNYQVNLHLNDNWSALYYDGSSTLGTDYRVSGWFGEGDEGGTTLLNLSNSSFRGGTENYSGKSILGVNLFRIAEMYYIMVEYLLDVDSSLAKQYYNDVVKTRGLDELVDMDLTLEMLYNERRKEFYGEGLLWSVMKRDGMDIKVSAGLTLSGSDVKTYKIPMPLSEEENRDEQ